MSPGVITRTTEALINGGPVITEVNRESWLNELASMIHPMFKGWGMKPYRLTCGWPCRGGLGRRRRVVGECHALESSKAGIHEIFISPTLEKPDMVAGTVCHEMAHVAAGIKAAHGKDFVKVCRAVGLTSGRATSVMPGPLLEKRLERILMKMGPYPHSAVMPALKPCKPRTSVSLTCPACPCRVTMGLKCFQEIGPPTCACGSEMELIM